MGRLFALLFLLLLPAQPMEPVQQVFFSMLFPQLIPWSQQTDGMPGEAVLL